MYIKELFVNICIMCTLAFIYGQMMQIHQFKHPTGQINALKLGLVGGVFGSILMIFGIQFPPHLIIDYRNIALTFAALLGGKWAILLAGLIMSVFRIYWYGISYTSLIGAVTILITTLGIMRLLGITLNQSRKWILIYSYATLCSLIGIAGVLLNDLNTLLLSTSIFVLMSGIGGCIAYVLYYFLEEVKDLYAKLKKEVENDYLTGLKNKKHFSESLEHIFQSFNKTNSLVGVIMFDIDHFKRINDTYGHLSGDAILSQLGKLTQVYFADEAHCKGVFRIGGEEFAVLIQGESFDNVLEKAEGLRQKVADHTFLLQGGAPIQVTISLGVSYYPDLTESPYNLVQEADEALYRSKDSGRNKVSWGEILHSA